MALPDERALRLLAKRKLETGTLPQAAPEVAFAGKGSGLPCSLCEQLIAANDWEFEYGCSDGKISRFHLRCESVWQLMLVEWRKASCLKHE